MKLKRAKAYKKLLHQYELNFGFREPYQVLLDSQILEDAYKFKIDLIPRLQKVLGGQVKPMITTCDMRHLYNAKPKNETLISQAKEYERRRCNHQDLEAPLSTQECLHSVVDAKDSKTNKHRYIVASDDLRVRATMRGIAGVPLVYISKSVVLMEPMTNATEEQRDREERSKFKQGLKGRGLDTAGKKRKQSMEHQNENEHEQSIEEASGKSTKKRRQRGPKEPNPLSVKRSKKAKEPLTNNTKEARISTLSQEDSSLGTALEDGMAADGDVAEARKRKRKHRPKGETGGDEEDGGVPI